MLSMRVSGRHFQRRALRLIGWNALLGIAGVGAVAAGAEVYLRLTAPFFDSSHPRSFHPQAGRIGAPGAEVRWTNRLDFWTISRNNSLGFLDREPPPPQRAAASCHVAILGDSFVEARQVPIGDKLQVRLEELAAQRMPAANVTTSAFGVHATGQIAQLGYYDAFVRRLRPKLVVLVFTPNDLIDNFPAWRAAETGLNPQHIPSVSAVKDADGGMRLQPPDPDYAQLRLQSTAGGGSASWVRSAARTSWLAKWLSAKAHALRHSTQPRGAPERSAPSRWSRSRDWRPNWPAGVTLRAFSSPPPPLVDRALDYTAFALNEFTERARRDDFSLVILETQRAEILWGTGAVRARVRELAARRGIFVIDQAEYILRRGGELRDVVWAHNDHWNAAGHFYAAEALLEHLQRRPEICDRVPAG